MSALFNFQDGAFGDDTHAGAFSVALINAINASGNTLSLNLDRSASNDGAAFDFFCVIGQTATGVPAPTSLALSGLALAALGVARRRRAG